MKVNLYPSVQIKILLLIIFVSNWCVSYSQEGNSKFDIDKYVIEKFYDAAHALKYADKVDHLKRNSIDIIYFNEPYNSTFLPRFFTTK